ncbi:TIGR01777 family oxidoreductase [Ferrimicrobium sp.]|uniref:TIGR01777 family oxidoreductase n=1 Tax=Ferrimicrobium sp. TaxID=2926050 RepID=UPI00260C28BF|nr:TIGR01777 family oxidoreductase [Ferrimicrobium sp.]
MRIGLTGSHGLIGSALRAALVEGGHEVTVIARSSGSSQRIRPVGSAPSSSEPFFDPDGGEGDLRALEGYQAIIHLAGEPIGDHRWDARVRSRIYSSRVYGTRSLVGALKALEQPPSTLLFASAAGIYGDRGGEVLTEESASGTGFLAKVVGDWEAEAMAGESIAKRVVLLRTGLVLDPKGGLLGRLLPLFKLGLGGRLATGEQYMSWITLEDEVRAIQHCLTEEKVRGPVNLAAPNPVTNREFTSILAGALSRPAIFTVPAGVLELVLGKEMARELALVSQRITPQVLEASGFSFSSTRLDEAIAPLIATTR